MKQNAMRKNLLKLKFISLKHELSLLPSVATVYRNCLCL